MKGEKLKLNKGGLDTIIAYIVVILPLLYVLIYMVATIYHYSVQTYMNQVVKEAAVMVSTYGEITEGHENYIKAKLKGVLGEDENGETKCTISYYRRDFIGRDHTDVEKRGTVGELKSYSSRDQVNSGLEKADIIGIYVVSKEPSLLDTVTSFSIFSGANSYYDANQGGDHLMYTAYKEEIIRNESPTPKKNPI